jgi:hypothetical protein
MAIPPRSDRPDIGDPTDTKTFFVFIAVVLVGLAILTNL